MFYGFRETPQFCSSFSTERQGDSSALGGLTYPIDARRHSRTADAAVNNRVLRENRIPALERETGRPQLETTSAKTGNCCRLFHQRLPMRFATVCTAVTYRHVPLPHQRPTSHACKPIRRSCANGSSHDEVPPPNVRDFFGLAVVQIRRLLIDLARHYFGPRGIRTYRSISRQKAACNASAFPVVWGCC